LTIWFRDKKYRSLRLFLNYTVFFACDVIARNVELHNGESGEVTIRKLMSVMMDLPESDYSLLTLNGSWAKEAHIQEAPVR
jgi:alpha-galactosidase